MAFPQSLQNPQQKSTFPRLSKLFLPFSSPIIIRLVKTFRIELVRLWIYSSKSKSPKVLVFEILTNLSFPKSNHPKEVSRGKSKYFNDYQQMAKSQTPRLNLPRVVHPTRNVKDHQINEPPLRNRVKTHNPTKAQHHKLWKSIITSTHHHKQHQIKHKSNLSTPIMQS